MSADQRDAERPGRETEGAACASLAVRSHVKLRREGTERSAQPDHADRPRAAILRRIAGKAPAERERRTQSVVESCGQAGLACRGPSDPVVDGKHRHVLLDSAEPEHKPARRNLTCAEIDPADLLAGLSLRAIEDQSDGVETKRQRHVQKFVATTRGRGLCRAQDLVDVQFDVFAQRQLAAEIQRRRQVQRFKRS